MIPPTLSREQARQLDRRAIDEFGVPGVVLMENAGRGVADCLCRLGIGGPVVVCAGAGNNGGDGFVVARHLDLRGYAARVLLFSDPARLAGDAAMNYRILEASGLPIQRFDLVDLAAELAGAAPAPGNHGTVRAERQAVRMASRNGHHRVAEKRG